MDPALLILAISAIFCALSIATFHRSRSDVWTKPAQTSASHVGAWDLRTIFGLALALRIGAVVVIGLAGIEDFFAPDRFGYEAIGRRLAHSWSGDNSIASPVVDTIGPYHYYNGIFFLAVGELAPWVVRLINAVVGAWTVRVVYTIGRSVADEHSAQIAATLVAIMPSLVLWSALNIRDAWAVLAILLTVRAAITLRERISTQSIVVLILSLALLGALRGYMFLIVAFGILMSYVSALGKGLIRSYAAGAIFATIFLYLYASAGFGQNLLEQASFETLDAMREGLTHGAGSSFYEEVDISTPEKALAFLPVGVTYFLLAPFPWNIRNGRMLLTLPEMLVWWWLFARYLSPGIREALRRQSRAAVTALSVVVFVVCAYGLVEGNVGTAYRHRSQILPLLLAFAAVGISAARRRAASFGDTAAVVPENRNAGFRPGQ